jgi:hypothetical protein
VSLWDELSKRDGGGSSPSWGRKQGSSPSYRPPSVPSSAPASPRTVPAVRETKPELTYSGDPTDKPYAYVQRREEGHVEEWRPPSFWEIMAELGLRALEAALVGAFSEMALFFTRRRFTAPRDRR